MKSQIWLVCWSTPNYIEEILVKQLAK
jgi:hypothetical protein